MMVDFAVLARAGEYSLIAVELERIPDGPDKQQLIAAMLSLAFVLGKNAAAHEIRRALAA